MSIQRYKLFALMVISCSLSGCSGCQPTPGSFTPTAITLKEVPGKNLKELQDDSLRFVDQMGKHWIAPKGTWTDGATVPRLALWFSGGRFEEEFLKAAVVHDAYCQEFNADRCPDQYQKESWKKVHRMFYEACVTGNTNASKAKLMFAAVWLAGPRWDDPDRDMQIVPNEVLRAGFDDCKAWIEEDNPTREQIESWMDNREPTVLAVSKLQSETLKAFSTRDLAKVDRTLEQSEELIAEGLEKAPRDLMLLNLKGYHHKNLAIKYRDAEMGDKKDEQLKAAEETFQEILSNEADNPSALNGLGSVFILRNDLDRAEEYVRKALETAPDYPAAKHDLELIDTLRRSQPPE